MVGICLCVVALFGAFGWESSFNNSVVCFWGHTCVNSSVFGNAGWVCVSWPRRQTSGDSLCSPDRGCGLDLFDSDSLCMYSLSITDSCLRRRRASSTGRLESVPIELLRTGVKETTVDGYIRRINHSISDSYDILLWWWAEVAVFRCVSSKCLPLVING